MDVIVKMVHENGSSNFFFKVDAYNKTTDNLAKESCWAPSNISTGPRGFFFYSN
jgi:hypothetical protein